MSSSTATNQEFTPPVFDDKAVAPAQNNDVNLDVLLDVPVTLSMANRPPSLLVRV